MVNLVTIMVWAAGLGFLSIVAGIPFFFIFRRKFQGYKNKVIIEKIRDGAHVFETDWAKQISHTEGKGIKKATAWLLYKNKHNVPLIDNYKIDSKGNIILDLFSPTQGVYYHKRTTNDPEAGLPAKKRAERLAKTQYIPRALIEEHKQELRQYYNDLVYNKLGWFSKNPHIVNIIMYGMIIVMVLIIVAVIFAPKLAALSGGIDVQCLVSEGAATVAKPPISGI